MPKILHKRNDQSGQVPLVSELALGELAINTYDGVIYTKVNNGSESIIAIDAGTDPTGLETVSEGQGSGWRFIGENANYHITMGYHAVDMTYGLPSNGIDQRPAGAMGQSSFAAGAFNQAIGESSTALGFNTDAQNDHMLAAGRFNIGDSDKTLFEFGIGTNESLRKNAFEIYTDGRLTAPELTTALINTPRSLTTKEYVDSSISGGITAARFTDLSDTPGALAADKWLKVDSTGNYLEWVDNTGGVNVINDLQDVLTTTPILNDHYLGYDLASNTWVNRAIIAADISDFSIPQNVNNGDVLTYNAATQQWETGIISGGTF